MHVLSYNYTHSEHGYTCTCTTEGTHHARGQYDASTADGTMLEHMLLMFFPVRQRSSSAAFIKTPPPPHFYKKEALKHLRCSQRVTPPCCNAINVQGSRHHDMFSNQGPSGSNSSRFTSSISADSCKPANISPKCVCNSPAKSFT